MTLQERIDQLSDEEVKAIVDQERPRDCWKNGEWDETAFWDLMIWLQGGVIRRVEQYKKGFII